jgi:hypothetical protein
MFSELRSFMKNKQAAKAKKKSCSLPTAFADW